MKNLIIAFCMLMSAGLVMGQTSKGTVLFGSSMDITGGTALLQGLAGVNSVGFASIKSKTKLDDEEFDGPKYTIINFSPSVGFAVTDGLFVGADLSFFSLKQTDQDDDEYKTSSLAAGPFVRYYIPAGDKLFPFAEAAVGFGTLKDEGFGDEDKTSFTQLGGKAGLSFFLGSSIALDVSVGYTYINSKDPDSDVDYKTIESGFGLGVGVTALLSK